MTNNKDVPAVILLVEDEALLRMFADDFLVEDGVFRVIAASNSNEALKILRVRHDIRLIFTELDVSGTVDGLQLAHIVDLRWPDIAIIVTSGRGEPRAGSLPDKALLLPKPYGATALLALVRELLGLQDGALDAPQAEVSADLAPAAPVLPRPVNLDSSAMGNGLTGGLAQPLPEPEE